MSSCKRCIKLNNCDKEKYNYTAEIWCNSYTILKGTCRYECGKTNDNSCCYECHKKDKDCNKYCTDYNDDYKKCVSYKVGEKE